MCPVTLADRYAARISGPLRDRIDLWVTMPRLPPTALVRGDAPEDSATVAQRVRAAREEQRRRSANVLNGRLRGRALRTACALDELGKRRAIELADLERLSGRGTERLLRVARTIADLEGAATVVAAHLEEAARYRPPASRLAQRAAS
jgi:magnesium chelatase family protein